MWQFAGGGTYGLSMKMGEREVANIQLIITPTGVDRDTALSLDGTEKVRPENTIQIVPTALGW